MIYVKKQSPRMQIILSMLIFGTIGVFRRWIPYPSSVVALARSVIGLAFLLLVRAAKRERVNRAAVKRNLWKLLLLGTMMGINWIFLFEAYNYTSVAAATMCYYMAPVFIILLSPIVFGEKITPRKGICAAVAVFGMVLVSDVLKSGLHGAKGLLFGLIAAALYAAVVIGNRTLKDISAEDRTVMQFAGAAAVMLPYVLLTVDLPALEPTPSALLLLLLVGVVHTGIAYVLYFGGIASVSAQTAALLSYIDPVVAVILSLTILKEPMSPAAMLGAVLVIGAMIISEITPQKD
ncbi:MAG: EamA family transporter [Oscillospiraceae bacterium]|nr:EamA family transporter [Oscillospiraceae bacterium]